MRRSLAPQFRLMLAQAIPGYAGRPGRLRRAASRADATASRVWVFDWRCLDCQALGRRHARGVFGRFLAPRSLVRNGTGEHELGHYLWFRPDLAGRSNSSTPGTGQGALLSPGCLLTARTGTALDQHQVLRYRAWYRYITLATPTCASRGGDHPQSPGSVLILGSRSHSPRSDVCGGPGGRGVWTINKTAWILRNRDSEIIRSGI
jgi:hypothetical protein